MEILLAAGVHCCRTGPGQTSVHCMATGRWKLQSDWSAGERDVTGSFGTTREIQWTGARLV